MTSSNSNQIVGYWYMLGMHMVVCHGPIDELVKHEGG